MRDILTLVAYKNWNVLAFEQDPVFVRYGVTPIGWTAKPSFAPNTRPEGGDPGETGFAAFFFSLRNL
jgi:hypothetical protein